MTTADQDLKTHLLLIIIMHRVTSKAFITQTQASDVSLLGATIKDNIRKDIHKIAIIDIISVCLAGLISIEVSS